MKNYAKAFYCFMFDIKLSSRPLSSCKVMSLKSEKMKKLNDKVTSNFTEMLSKKKFEKKAS
jgi:hypothetical protein